MQHRAPMQSKGKSKSKGQQQPMVDNELMALHSNLKKKNSI